MLTRCPHCDARFKVTEAQLSVANGKVRCGNCMQVFNAREHLLPSALVSQPASARAPASDRTIVRPSSAVRATPGNKPSGRPETPAVVAGPAATRNMPEPPAADSRIPPKSPAKPSDPVAAALQEASRNADEDDLDDIIFQDNPEEDKEDEHYAGGPLINESDLSEELRELDKGKPDMPATFGTEVVDDEDSEAGESDESWAEAMLRELESGEAAGRRDREPAPEKVIHTPESLNVEPIAPPAMHSRPEPPPIQAIPADTLSQLRRAHLQDEEPEPQSGQWIWGLGSLLLILTLLAQLAWLHFDRLARFDQLRPLYAKACAVLGCELPPLLDIKQIRNRNLAVRNHPTVQNALIVDAIIINEASFDQPFPNIALSFKDINGNVIAYRLFTPEEYLAGDAVKLKSMPSRTPIHIALEILHPGKEAVNYELSFHPATYSASPTG
ncbi:DUF3426 domain-containing protein [Hahella sp. SMD15-11]|uniref:DUF3426 domain-containing protein n=1 Tax=Thermohahella caldifontis TaxID=3142973 RepID=A0AB39UUR3_9GAMM